MAAQHTNNKLVLKRLKIRSLKMEIVEIDTKPFLEKVKVDKKIKTEYFGKQSKQNGY